jgi:hypothetical protein
VTPGAGEACQGEDEGYTTGWGTCWLSALPTSPVKRFSELQWRIGVRMRLGLLLTREPISDLCPLCGNFVEDLGYYTFKCPYSENQNARVERHNQLSDILIGDLVSWGFSVEKESLIQTKSWHRDNIEVMYSDSPIGSVCVFTLRN